MLTNKEILECAMKQSAIDLNCKASDFLQKDNVIVASKKDDRARRYLPLPFDCDMVTYGTNIVATINEKYREVVEAYLHKVDIEHCFETPNIYRLNNAFSPYGISVCFQAEYFLPDVNLLKKPECAYELRVLEQKDFVDLYDGTWSNALCEDRKELDVLGVGAYDQGKLIALAGCSADCDTMWQIGIDVLPEYRRQGIASILTSRLANEIIERGKVPFYCAAWCNIKSVRNAIRSGFRPGWMEMTVRSNEFIQKMTLTQQRQS